MGTAESCTGGLLAKLLTDLPGSLCPALWGHCQLCQCGESRCLGVPQTLLTNTRGLSQVARGHGPRGQSRSGVRSPCPPPAAGLEPDDRGNPIGLVYLGLAWGEQCQVVPLHAGQVDRDRIRRQAAQTALDPLQPAFNGAEPAFLGQELTLTVPQLLFPLFPPSGR
ncbi:MAG: CinA family protein [Evtepia gabavorous]